MCDRVNRREFLAASSLSGLALGLVSPGTTRAQERDRPRYEPSKRPRAEADARPADEVGRPYVVYNDRVNDFTPGGLMPDGTGVAVNPNCRDHPKEGEKCVRIAYRLEDNLWVGVAFLLDNQLEPKRTFDLYEALGDGVKKVEKGEPIFLRFHVRSADGATAKFKVAGMPQDACRFGVETAWQSFDDGWTPVEINLTKADLSSLHGALIVVLDREHNAGLKKPEIQIDLDRIYFTRVRRQDPTP